MPHHRDDPPCPECGERPGTLIAEIERLRSALAEIADGADAKAFVRATALKALRNEE